MAGLLPPPAGMDINILPPLSDEPRFRREPLARIAASPSEALVYAIAVDWPPPFWPQTGPKLKNEGRAVLPIPLKMLIYTGPIASGSFLARAGELASSGAKS